MKLRKRITWAGLGAMAALLGMALSPQSASAAPVYQWASEIVSFEQGRQLNDQSIPASRSTAGNALHSNLAPAIGDVDFVSLGFGGSITLGFDRLFTDDIAIVYETTYNNRTSYPETADLYVSTAAHPDVFILAGSISNAAASGEIRLSGLPAEGPFQYVRIIDTTDPSYFLEHQTWSADGFDLNAVRVTAVPLPTTAWAGSALMALLGLVKWRRHRAD